MPPTFFIFLGLIVYFGLIAMTLIVFVPMLLFRETSLIAKKVIATVLISFPCLIIMGLFWAIIFAIPALGFSWLANTGFIPKTIGIVLIIIGALIFLSLIALSSLYLWYFTSRIIYKRIDKKPISEYLEKDRFFNYLKPTLVKMKLYRSMT